MHAEVKAGGARWSVGSGVVMVVVLVVGGKVRGGGGGAVAFRSVQLMGTVKEGVLGGHGFWTKPGPSLVGGLGGSTYVSQGWTWHCPAGGGAQLTDRPLRPCQWMMMDLTPPEPLAALSSPSIAIGVCSRPVLLGVSYQVWRGFPLHLANIYVSYLLHYLRGCHLVHHGDG